MAKSILKSDIAKIHAELVATLGENYDSTAWPWYYLTRDNWRALIGGWHHADVGWSRGFMVSDNLGGMNAKHRGHVSPCHDGGRYEGRGWHQRMALDIRDAINELRRNCNE